MSPHRTDQMSQRSQVSNRDSLGSLCNVKIKSHWLTQSVTRSPIELFWTATKCLLLQHKELLVEETQYHIWRCANLEDLVPQPASIYTIMRSRPLMIIRIVHFLKMWYKDSKHCKCYPVFLVICLGDLSLSFLKTIANVWINQYKMFCF